MLLASTWCNHTSSHMSFDDVCVHFFKAHNTCFFIENKGRFGLFLHNNKFQVST